MGEERRSRRHVCRKKEGETGNRTAALQFLTLKKERKKERKTDRKKERKKDRKKERTNERKKERQKERKTERKRARGSCEEGLLMRWVSNKASFGSFCQFCHRDIGFAPQAPILGQFQWTCSPLPLPTHRTGLRKMVVQFPEPLSSRKRHGREAPVQAFRSTAATPSEAPKT